MLNRSHLTVTTNAVMPIYKSFRDFFSVSSQLDSQSLLWRYGPYEAYTHDGHFIKSLISYLFYFHF